MGAKDLRACSLRNILNEEYRPCGKDCKCFAYQPSLGWVTVSSHIKLDISRTTFLQHPVCSRGMKLHSPAKRHRFHPTACESKVSKGGSAGTGSEEDRNARDNFFDNLRKITESETALSNPLGLKKSFEILRFDGNAAEEPRDRYVYVEERDCIGCTHCATTATGTFFMEEEYGRARVFDQLGDNDSTIEVAIDTCPVNCIYYVDWTDLVALEKMRDGQVINSKARLVGGQDLTASIGNKVKTTVMDSGIMRCSNCPKRGCSECPLYGVGENPEYQKRKAQRESRAKKRGDSGQGQRRRL